MHRAKFCPLIAAAILAAAAASAATAAPSARFAASEPSAVVRVGGDEALDERHDDRYARRRGPVVDAPGAYVDAGDPVIVDAPGTHVGVHRDRIRVIAPFVDLSIPR
jgi:hypothetical protein